MFSAFLVQLNFQFPKEANKEMLDIGICLVGCKIVNFSLLFKA